MASAGEVQDPRSNLWYKVSISLWNYIWTDVWPAPEKSETLGVTYDEAYVYVPKLYNDGCVASAGEVRDPRSNLMWRICIHACRNTDTSVWSAPEQSKTLGVTYDIQYLHRTHTNENTKKDTLIVTQFLQVFSRLLQKSVSPKMSRNVAWLFKQRFWYGFCSGKSRNRPFCRK